MQGQNYGRAFPVLAKPFGVKGATVTAARCEWTRRTPQVVPPYGWRSSTSSGSLPIAIRLDRFTVLRQTPCYGMASDHEMACDGTKVRVS